MYLPKGALISGDAGHNCYPDSGAVGIRVEDNCTKAVWNLVQVKLRDLGYYVKDCTPWNMSFNSVGASLAYRVKKANESSSSLHLCIHFNAGGGKGVECWISDFGGRSEKFASNICEEFSKLGYYNRGIKSGNLYVANYTNMPCVIIECCFVDSRIDMDLYNSEDIANAIVKAVTGEQSFVKNVDTSPSFNSENINMNYRPNAVVQYDWLYVRDFNGQIEPERRVDIGDKIEVLSVSSKSQLAYIIYPTPWGVRNAYVANGKWISYFNPNNGEISQSIEVRQDPDGIVIGSLSKGEKITILKQEGNWVNVVYSTNKGEFTKSGWIPNNFVNY
ncbi:bacteriophage endolysin (N-acetylmuramoyl-L-alanine amidase) [Clostridium polyendosporum]|uniref:Bacteriophage endolysin (N-acetylmuramoyl-L-alanine amidase) n=1 Tax=Clostridium polyendosporum TaxID=69208 RepID=A0A919RX79_9CLOT|nr:N-acetylmuramoyl-L-alanine amidase [Clostridium polyendosporum]GIM27439.1 bacteriophage endolysin (N-acetylmuramoyl-L-alanine amidase) [Clostridium polyendosporum]